MADLTPNATAVMAGIFAALAVGSMVRVIWAVVVKGSGEPSRFDSLKTWWVLTLLFGAAVFLGEHGVAVLFVLASLLGMREFLHLSSKTITRRIPPRWIYLLVLLHYAGIAWAGYEAIWVALPALTILIVALLRIMKSDPSGYLQEVGMTAWGFLLLVFCFSHAALLVTLPESLNPVGGSMGWLIYLVVLTQTNDVAQALWGRQVGKHRVTPRLSPNKTWEGLLLGALTTVSLAIGLGCWLTPFGNDQASRNALPAHATWWLWPLVAGAIIAIGGFLGDLNMSAVKRDTGVKDSGTMLPGQGGILDRIDSLTFTAPLFYYYIYALHAADG